MKTFVAVSGAAAVVAFATRSRRVNRRSEEVRQILGELYRDPVKNHRVLSIVESLANNPSLRDSEYRIHKLLNDHARFIVKYRDKSSA